MLKLKNLQCKSNIDLCLFLPIETTILLSKKTKSLNIEYSNITMFELTNGENKYMKKINIEPIPDIMDKSFRFMGDKQACNLYENLRLPGKVIKVLKSDFVEDLKKGLRMDLLLLVEMKINNEVKEVLVNIEHQSSRVNFSKIKIIDDYKNLSKCKYNLPLLTVIVSPYPKEKHENVYKSTESDILKPKFICIDDEEIEKRLELLENNIFNEDIEEHIIINIGLISIFVLNNRYEVLKKLCELISASTSIKGEIREQMIKILSEMIKFKLQDDELKVLELLDMIKKEDEYVEKGYRIFYEEEYGELEEKLNEKESEILKKNEEISEKDEELNKKILKINNISMKYEDTLKSILQKDARIKELERQLSLK